ncbi:MAG: class I SAM-dependent methyltransferase [Methanobacteriota archaeon]
MVQGDFEFPFSAYQQEAWEIRYRMKGRQWGNAPAEFSSIVNTGVILELGIGDGKNLRARRHEGVLPIGIDFSLAALQLCCSDPTLSGTPLLLGDVCYLPIRNNTVHQIFAHHILGHIPLRFCEMMIDELHRVLQPEGIVSLTVFASGDMRYGMGEEVEKSTFLRGDGIITRYFSHEDIIILARKFTILDLKYQEWPLRIRGQNLKRAVFIGKLQKII